MILFVIIIRLKDLENKLSNQITLLTNDADDGKH